MADQTQNCLSCDERDALGRALDALLPPDGAFPAPSETDIIDDFILKHLPVESSDPGYPGLDLANLKSLISTLVTSPDMTTALRNLEKASPERFQALWALAVYGYYSRKAVTAAIQSDLAVGYHGAPLPLGYEHVIRPWDASSSRQMPSLHKGSYTATGDVRRVDLSGLEVDR